MGRRTYAFYQKALEKKEKCYAEFCESTMYANRSQNMQIAAAKNKMRTQMRKLRNKILQMQTTQ